MTMNDAPRMTQQEYCDYLAAVEAQTPLVAAEEADLEEQMQQEPESCRCYVAGLPIGSHFGHKGGMPAGIA